MLSLKLNATIREIVMAVNKLISGELPRYTVATLPPGKTGQFVYVSDETGGAIPAFFDGTDWRRVSDRAIVS